MAGAASWRRSRGWCRVCGRRSSAARSPAVARWRRNSARAWRRRSRARRRGIWSPAITPRDGWRHDWCRVLTEEARMSDLYEDDILLWSEQQAELLRRRAANDLDWANLAEEIEDVGKSQLR